MNYIKIHDAILARAMLRHKPTGYVERHHVIPRHAGGSDDKSNLVYLTAREHFVVHLIRAKVFGGKEIYAANRMSTSQGGAHYGNSRLFAIARKLFAYNNSGDNNSSRKPSAKLAKGDSHPRRTNPESYAHLKGAKREINARRGDDHPRRKNPELWDGAIGKNHPRVKNPELWIGAMGDNHWTRNNPEFSARMIANNPMKNPLISAKLMGKNSSQSKAVRCIDTNVIHDSIGNAAKSVNGSKGNIWSACNGRLKVAYGFRWEYVV